MTYENRMLRCRNCRFWWPVGEGAHEATRARSVYGQCRRYAPPVAVLELPEHKQRYIGWAVSRGDDWCGEHSHTEIH